MQSLKLFRTVLFVKNVSVMARFYRDVLGLSSVADSDDNWQVYSAGGFEVALHQIPKPWCDEIVITDPPTPREESPHKLIFLVDDLVAARDELIERGAHIMDNKFLNPSGQLLRCDFLDPEGNVFQVTSEAG
jgi:predicted enzyme related to lactoylglutathione lyase